MFLQDLEPHFCTCNWPHAGHLADLKPQSKNILDLPPASAEEKKKASTTYQLGAKSNSTNDKASPTIVVKPLVTSTASPAAAASAKVDDEGHEVGSEPLSFELRWKKCTDAIISRLMSSEQQPQQPPTASALPAARFASVFADEPGQTAMSYGPDSKEVAKAVEKIDEAIGRLLDQLQEMDLWPQKLNLIVTSSPGYAKLTPNHLIDLSTYVDPKLWEAVGDSPVLNIRPLSEYRN